MVSSVGSPLTFNVALSQSKALDASLALNLTLSQSKAPDASLTYNIALSQSKALDSSLSYTLSPNAEIDFTPRPLPYQLSLSAISPDASQTSVTLSSTWKFQTDPTNTGKTSGWGGSGFDDSGWGTLLSGSTWISQGVNYSGYAWYRQAVPLNIPMHNGQWLVIVLAPLANDDLVYWNDNVVGGITGNSQYRNLQNRTYFIPPSMVQNNNVLAIRCWGGPNLNLNSNNAGLIAGTYSISVYSGGVWVRPHGGTESQEIPAGAYDLSSAQNGAPFDLVIRPGVDISAMTNPVLAYTITNLYDGTVLATGSQGMVVGADGQARAIISIGSNLAVQIYFTGNISATYNIQDNRFAWTNTGQIVFINDSPGSGTPLPYTLWSKTFSAGTVTLPPRGFKEQVAIAMYSVFIPDNTVTISGLTVDDPLTNGGIADSTYWSVKSNAQVGNSPFGDNLTPQFSTLPSLVTGGQWIQVAANSKYWGGDPPLAGPMATFTINKTTNVYIAIDNRTPSVPWNDCGQQILINITSLFPNAPDLPFELFGQYFAAGKVSLPPAVSNTNFQNVSFYVIPDTNVVLSNLVVNDFSENDATQWFFETDLRVNATTYSDLGFKFSVIPTAFQGAQWIQPTNHSKAKTSPNPFATFVIDRPAWVFIAQDSRLTTPPGSVINATETHLNFSARDNLQLSALSVEHDVTPFGSLKLVDVIDCSTPTISEVHPYLQGGALSYGSAAFNTPGSTVDCSVITALGLPARRVDYGFFAYRIGRGGLTPGKQYVLACTYPEDVPRFVQLGIEAGQGYIHTGWRVGLTGNIYDPWPLSNAWETNYQVFSLGTQAVGSGGSESADAVNGVWIYFQGQVNLPNGFYSMYSGGPAIGQIKLYEIDPVANAPVINFPDSLPRRALLFDWERPAQMPPADVCNYAKLVGYNAIAPLIGVKWGQAHYGDPLVGYWTGGTDSQNYLWFNVYTPGAGVAPPSLFPATPSLHKQFLDATATAGLDYYPRFEYGGSFDLPVVAQSVNAAGQTAVPDRFGAFGANILHADTYNEMVALIDNLCTGYTSTYPNFKGLFWRQRRDSLQISYGAADIAMFTADTGNTPPGGLTAAQLGNWASTGSIQPLYATWWHGKRTAFHYRVLDYLQTHRGDLSLMYFNWDEDKFSLLIPELIGLFYQVASQGGAVAYGNNLTAREALGASDYITALQQGNFSGETNPPSRPDALWPDYAILPNLYNRTGVKVLAPFNYQYNMLPSLVQYFETGDGVAVSNISVYVDLGLHEENPRYETSEMVSGGRSYSMSIEVQSWCMGDANTLTWSSYTFGRACSDYHRSFAQAYLALPAIAGTTIGGMPSNVTARTYASGSKTYLGVGYTGLTPQTLNLNIPGSWPAYAAVTDLVTNHTVIVQAGSALPMNISALPMQLNAFLVVPSDGPSIMWQAVGEIIT